jgi:hypothetical protein
MASPGSTLDTTNHYTLSRMTTADRKKQVELIRSTFRALDNQFQQNKYSYFPRAIMLAATASEKAHRTTTFGEPRQWGISVENAAMLFTVRGLAQYLTDSPLPQLKDILGLRLEYAYAASAVAGHEEELRAFYEKENRLAQVLALDYAALVKA